MYRFLNKDIKNMNESFNEKKVNKTTEQKNKKTKKETDGITIHTSLTSI